MKKLLLCILASLGIFTAQAGAPIANHVIVIGLDAWGSYSFAKSDMPRVKALMDSASFTLKNRSVLPSSSAVNWASMFMGVGPELHGYTEWGSATPEIPSRVVSHSGTFPTIFRVLRDARPDAEIGAVYEWDVIKCLVDSGALSHDEFIPDRASHPDDTWRAAASYIVEKKPNLALIYFEEPDVIGHHEGHDTPAYYDQLHTLDGYVGNILDAIQVAGIADDTVVILVADHGGVDKGHGGKSLLEMEVPLIFAGKGVKKTGKEFDEVTIQFDLAATIAHILGLERPQAWRGQPATWVFEQQ